MQLYDIIFYIEGNKIGVDEEVERCGYNIFWAGRVRGKPI